ncbi:MAG TPA: replication-relaxation family protein [Herpetosiphonaceae bacterium]
MMRALQMTDRDRAILQSLAEARFLTIAALEWLHLPARRGHWEAAYRTRQPYIPSRSLYDRMKRMHAAKLVLRIKRSVTHASAGFGREPDVYALAPDGAAWLAEAAGITAPAIRADRLRTRSVHTLAHSVSIGTFYAAMRTKVEAMGLRVTGWQSDHALSQSNYDRLLVRVTQANGAVTQQRLPVLPDGAFSIVNQGTRYLFFVEIDRGRHVST